MSNLSDAIITYSGNSKEGLQSYINATIKDAKRVMTLITIMALSFIAIFLISYGLETIGIYTPDKPTTSEDITRILILSLGIIVGGIVSTAFLCQYIIQSCKEQIAKIEYAEQFERVE